MNSLQSGIINRLIDKQAVNEDETDRICNKLDLIWLDQNSPAKYAVPCQEASILIRAMENKIAELKTAGRKGGT